MDDFSKKASPLTVVGGPSVPPRKLGEAGLSLWNRVQAEYQITDVGGVELLTQACLARDRAEALAAVIEADGERIITKTGIKDHPCLKHELAARSFIVRTLQRLGVTDEVIKPESIRRAAVSAGRLASISAGARSLQAGGSRRKFKLSYQKVGSVSLGRPFGPLPCRMIESSLPVPGKRGPYEKRMVV